MPPEPSDELLGYFHASAHADSKHRNFCATRRDKLKFIGHQENARLVNILVLTLQSVALPTSLVQTLAPGRLPND
jgi:hypothetical protein